MTGVDCVFREDVLYEIRKDDASFAIYVAPGALDLVDPLVCLGPTWDLFASGVEWLLSMGVLGWFLGLVALALAVSLFRTYGPAGGILSIMATFLLLWGIGDLPGALLPNPYQLLFILQDATYDNFVFFLLWLQGWVVCLGLIWVGARWFCKKFPPAET